ncbi:MAG: general secretion pathway protein GspB [Thalassolituus sp.]
MIKTLTVPFFCAALCYVDAALASDPMRPPQFAPTQVEAASVKNTSFRLQQIRVAGDTSSAIINGRLVHEGDSVQGARVVKITSDKVVLKYRQKLKTLSLLSNTKHSEK